MTSRGVATGFGAAICKQRRSWRAILGAVAALRARHCHATCKTEQCASRTPAPAMRNPGGRRRARRRLLAQTCSKMTVAPHPPPTADQRCCSRPAGIEIRIAIVCGLAADTVQLRRGWKKALSHRGQVTVVSTGGQIIDASARRGDDRSPAVRQAGHDHFQRHRRLTDERPTCQHVPSRHSTSITFDDAEPARLMVWTP